MTEQQAIDTIRARFLAWRGLSCWAPANLCAVRASFRTWRGESCLGLAWPEERRILVRVVQSDLGASLAIVLHELAHCAIGRVATGHHSAAWCESYAAALCAVVGRSIWYPQDMHTSKLERAQYLDAAAGDAMRAWMRHNPAFAQ